MALVVYTKLKELQIQETEIYEFGNWLKSFNKKGSWGEYEDFDDYVEDPDDEIDQPYNFEGEIMEYPWDEFSYIIVPDNIDEAEEAKELAEMLGIHSRFDISELDRLFFVVK